MPFTRLISKPARKANPADGKDRGIRHWLWFLVIGSIPSMIAPSLVRADEPAAKFLERLKDEGLYDQALKYLEISSQRNRLPASMKADLGLEKILLLQLSLKEVRSSKDVDSKLAAIENGYKEFLAGSPDHPRRGETLLKLADLYLARGGQLLEDSKAESKKDSGSAKAVELREKARVFYQQAYDTFGTTVETLRPILEKMQGANVKPNETDRLALREKLQTEYRQGQILQAITLKYLAETFEPQSAEWKQRLEEADKRLNEVADKSSRQPGAKYLSLLNRGQVQALLGQIDAARETFNRVAETDEAGIFRLWRVQAITGIVRLDSSPASGKYEAAIARGEDQWKLGDMREKDKPEWKELQLAIAEARLAWIASLDAKSDEGKIRNIRREAREGLQSVVKKPGPLQARARDLLKDLGIEAKAVDDTKLPDTKTFAESIKAARARLDRADEGDTTIQILQRQLATANEQEKKEIEDQIRTVQDDANRDRLQAIELNQRALSLYRDDDSREDLLQTRFLQSYLYLRLKRYWESVAISEVIMRTSKGSETAQKASSFALAGLGQLIENAPSDRQASLMANLERLARYLIDHSQGTPESDQAVDILVSLALRDKRWDEAERFIAMKGTLGGEKAFLLGRILWSQYRQNLYAHRQAKTEPTPEDLDLKQRAFKLLSASWSALTEEDISPGTLEGTNDLISFYLQEGRLDDALNVLNAPVKGAIAQASAIPELNPSIHVDTRRLNLQAMVQSAGQGKSDLSVAQVTSEIDTMKNLCDQTGDAAMLPRCLQNLAAELQSQLEGSKNPDQQAKLTAAFKILIDQLIGLSKDPAIIESAGAAMVVLATNLEKIPAMAASVPSLMESAEKAFEKLRGLSAADLEKIHRKPEEILLKLAMAKRGAKNYAEAHKLFIEALQKNANNITIQIEAANNLQKWSAGTDAQLLKDAMLGAEPGANKNKLIWGWGKIAQVTSKYPNFQKEFFDSRLNVARCRSLLADAQTSPPEKQKLYDAAISDISQTVVRFPELGGAATFAEFDRLLREIQQKAKKPVTGVAGLQAAGLNATPTDANGNPNK
ncbi:MAG: hypothetical protein WCI02_10140 [Planctomycetota bacterium]